MKKICCFCLVLLLCLSTFGCQKDDSSDTTSETTADEVEIIQFDYSKNVDGIIIEIIAPKTLVVELNSTHDREEWGETVHIITNETDEWCIGDDIVAKFIRAERPADTTKPVRIFSNQIYANVPLDDKPIIYLYPEAPTDCSVRITLDGKLTCTYPVCGVDGWQNFTAYPDGTLIFPDGKEYYALYWEGIQNTEWNFTQGRCVRGEDTAAFLEWALAEQGLTEREANEFIIYWLPLMQDNKYNVISFQTDAYTDGAVLDINPAPDSLLRVFMAYYPTDTEVDIQPQVFEKFERQGFTVVEWGGSKVSKP